MIYLLRILSNYNDKYSKDINWEKLPQRGVCARTEPYGPYLCAFGLAQKGDTKWADIGSEWGVWCENTLQYSNFCHFLSFFSSLFSFSRFRKKKNLLKSFLLGKARCRAIMQQITQTEISFAAVSSWIFCDVTASEVRARNWSFWKIISE